jgi:predicted TPR repeat methyltransferase
LSAAAGSAERFDSAYAADPDPWRVESSAYERRKREATLAALGDRRFGAALEVGCGTGVLSEELAQRCESVLACDLSAVALDLAAARLAAAPNVTLARRSFPEDLRPDGWDLIVCSEILYYLDQETFERALAWFALALRAGASLVAVHWRGSGSSEPLRGDDVHERLRAELAAHHCQGVIAARYRLDRFEPRDPFAWPQPG